MKSEDFKVGMKFWIQMKTTISNQHTGVHTAQAVGTEDDKDLQVCFNVEDLEVIQTKPLTKAQFNKETNAKLTVISKQIEELKSQWVLVQKELL